MNRSAEARRNNENQNIKERWEFSLIVIIVVIIVVMISQQSDDQGDHHGQTMIIRLPWSSDTMIKVVIKVCNVIWPQTLCRDLGSHRYHNYWKHWRFFPKEAFHVHLVKWSPDHSCLCLSIGWKDGKTNQSKKIWDLSDLTCDWVDMLSIIVAFNKAFITVIMGWGRMFRKFVSSPTTTASSSSA